MSVTVNGSSGLTFNDGSSQNTSPFTGGFGFRNRIINGNFVIDQRNAGASVTNSTGNIYTLDRWYSTSVGSSCTVQQVTGSTGNNKALRVTGASGNGTTIISQKIEASNIFDCASQTVTVSFTISGSSNGTIYVRFLYPTATDNFTSTTEPVGYTAVNFTTTPTRYTVTRTLDANANKGLYLVFERGATGSGVTWTIEDVQLEKGSTATSFDYRPYGTELALCQRYYWKFNSPSNQYNNFGLGVGAGSIIDRFSISNPVRMRTTPTGTGNALAIYDGSSVITVGGLGNNYSTVDVSSYSLSIASSVTAGKVVAVIANNSSTSFIDASAEL